MVKSDTMVFQKANSNEFDRIRAFYWTLIDAMAADNDKIGWKKGIYPTDDFLRDGLAKAPCTPSPTSSSWRPASS